MAATACSPRERSTARSSPKILTATLVREPDSMWSMRCEMGWPMVMLVPRHQRQALAYLLEHDLAGPSLLFQPHVDLGRLDSLHVLVELGPPRPPAGAGDLGHVEEQPLDGAPEGARLGEARPRQGHRADHQRALVERGQERPPQERGGRGRRHRQRARGDEHRARVPQRVRQQPRVAAPHRGGERRLAGVRDAAAARQQVVAEHRGQGQGHEQRAAAATAAAIGVYKPAPSAATTRAANKGATVSDSAEAIAPTANKSSPIDNTTRRVQWPVSATISGDPTA